MKLHTCPKHHASWHKLCISSLPPPKNTTKVIDSISSSPKFFIELHYSQITSTTTNPTKPTLQPLLFHRNTCNSCRICPRTLPPYLARFRSALPPPGSTQGSRRDERSEGPDSDKGDKGLSCLDKPTNTTYVFVFTDWDVYTWEGTSPLNGSWHPD